MYDKVPPNVETLGRTSERYALRDRIALAEGSNHTIRGVPFLGVHSLLRKARREDELERLCREFDIPTEPSVMAKYQAETFLRFEHQAAKVIEQEAGSMDGAVYICGYAAIEVFFDTLAGRTVKALSGGDPNRLLGSVPSGYQLLASFGSRSYERITENSGRFSFKEELLGPVHTAGIFTAAFESLHRLVPTIEVEQHDVGDFDFLISW